MSISITNSKVAGFDPRWAAFRGFSLLFDNPGNSLIAAGDGVSKAHCVPGADLALALYAGIAGFLAEMDTDRLLNTLLFCVLPVESYHVTVWDGLNDDNASEVNSIYRAQLARFFADMPASLSRDDVFTKQIMGSPLLSASLFTAPRAPLMLKVDHLAKWRNYALVAVLEPVDDASAQQLAAITEERARLSDRFEDEFHILLPRSYTPHITLGYFADHMLPAVDALDMAQFNARLLAHAGQLVISFESIGLYGFTDMTAFYRRMR